MKLWNPSSKQSAGSLWKGAVGIYYFTGLYYFRRHRLNWWWETQDWKRGNLMVSRAQMEKSKNLALFSFMPSWTLKLFILLSVILFKVSLFPPLGYWRTAFPCAAKWGRSKLFWFLPTIPGQFFPFNKPSGCTVAEASDRATFKFPFPIGLLGYLYRVCSRSSRCKTC